MSPKQGPGPVAAPTASWWRSGLRGAWRVLRVLLLAAAAAVLAFEEWGWKPLTAWAAAWARWPPLARLEARIARLAPRQALALFLLPSAMLLPVKLLALWFIERGDAGLGLAVIVVAKLLGTAVVGRLFILTEAQLMHFAWFARALTWWRQTKLRVKQAAEASRAWRMLKAASRRLRTRVRVWWGRAK